MIQTGTAHVWLGDKQYDAQSGAVVFIPAETWIDLRNIGNEDISLVAVWNEPSFEEMLRCGSVPKGQAAAPLSRDGVKECYHHGDAELETVQPTADTKPQKKGMKVWRLRTADGQSVNESAMMLRNYSTSQNPAAGRG